MVYPMPPGTTNINVTLNDHELAWSNYTQSSPNALHQTAIGNWWMIYSVLPNVSGFFTLRIHYEHPLETVNGSYLFLYDLNISPYLSEQSENSSAHFTVRFKTNFTDLHVYTAQPDSTAREWKPINYTTTTENSTKVVNILMYSEYPGVSGKSLPGDLVVEFSNANQTSDSQLLWLSAILLFTALLLVTAFYIKRRKISTRLWGKLLFYGFPIWCISRFALSWLLMVCYEPDGAFSVRGHVKFKEASLPHFFPSSKWLGCI